MNPSEIEIEARRQTLNVEQVFESVSQEWPAALEFQRTSGQHDLMLLTLRMYASQALMLGQAAWRLDGDAAKATQLFGRCVEWMDFCWEAIAGAPSAGSAKRTPLASKMLLEPMLCLVLANERECCERLWRETTDDVFARPDALVNSEKPQAAFSLDLIGAIGAAVPRYGEEMYAPASRMADLPTRGYEALLAALHSGDQAHFEAVRSRLLTDFSGRARSREAALNPWGYGEVAQAACFDAIATVLSRLAHWRSMPVGAEPPHCPQAFV